MKILVTLGLVLSGIICMHSQQFVQNGSFETTSDCPPGLSYSGYYSFVTEADTLHDFMRLAAPWYSPTSGTSDLFHSCCTNTVASVPMNTFGNAEAWNGDAYAAVICYHNTEAEWEENVPELDYTEFIQAPLVEPLIPGATYKASFRIRRASDTRYGIDQIGLAVHEGPQVVGDSLHITPLDLTPVLTTPQGIVITNDEEWQLFEAEFIPSAAVDHVTVGRFANIEDLEVQQMTTNSLAMVLRRAVYYFDEISIELVTIDTSIDTPETEPLKVNYNQGRLTYTADKLNAGPFRILDCNGKLVHEGRFEMGSGQIEIQLNEGIYFVQTGKGVTKLLAF